MHNLVNRPQPPTQNKKKNRDASKKTPVFYTERNLPVRRWLRSIFWGSFCRRQNESKFASIEPDGSILIDLKYFFDEKNMRSRGGAHDWGYRGLLSLVCAYRKGHFLIDFKRDRFFENRGYFSKIPKNGDFFPIF